MSSAGSAENARPDEVVPTDAEVRTYRSEDIVHRPIEEVFLFFNRPENLGKITPPWVGFSMLTPTPVPMNIGTVIDYIIRVHRIPVRWTTLISEYDPPYRFVDVQLRGPYSFWHHSHHFEEIPEGTKVVDSVRYVPPMGAFGGLLNALFIGRDVRRIFEFRKHQLKDMFELDE